MVRSINTILKECIGLKKDQYPFNKGTAPPWWPESIPHKELSKQVKPDLEKLLLLLLGFAQDDASLHREMAGELHRHDYR